METAKLDHYATLGLDADCTMEQVRDAYRLLAKQVHPDLNGGSREAVAQTQALNLAYENLSDPARRKDYDAGLRQAAKLQRSPAGSSVRNISEDVHLRLEDFFRGTTRDIQVKDPGNLSGNELYELVVPPGTAIGTRLRIQRQAGGAIIIRVLALPHFQFKVRGADLRCDLKISSKRAELGGEELVKGIGGDRLRVRIPVRVARGEIIRIAGEGLPGLRGGRGDLLVRILYQPQVKISRPVRR